MYRLQVWMVFLLLQTANAATAYHGRTDSLLHAIEAMPDDTNKVLALREVAFDFTHSAPDSALKLTRLMRSISLEKNFPVGMALAYDIEGNVFRLRGEYNHAANLHLQALRLLDSLKEKKRYRSVLVNTGSDYFFLKNYQKALALFEEALHLTDISETQRYGTIVNNIGNLYSTIGQPQKAIATYLSALPVIKGDSTYGLQSVIYSGLAGAYAASGEWQKAVYYGQESVNYAKVSGNTFQYAVSASTLAGFYIELKEYNKAAEYLEIAFREAKTIGAKSIIANYYQNMAHLSSRSGKPGEAYEWLLRYTQLNDSLINEAHVAELAESETRYKVEMKNRELELLNAEKALNDSELRRQQLWKYILMLLVVVIGMLLFFVYRSFRSGRKVNQTLEAENTLLQKENILAQYETLRTQINPHFLFNSLNALASLIKTDPAKAVEFTIVFSRLYRQVLELKGHSVITVQEDLELVDAYVYLQKIRFDDNLILNKHLDASVLDCVIPPFCLQMLIENAIKHNVVSDEHPLTISIYTENQFLVVANNLQPRPKTDSTGVGIKNITERFRLIHDVEPSFVLTDKTYLARIPLIEPLL